MRAHDAVHQPGGADGGRSTTGIADIVWIRPKAHLVEALHAMGLKVTLQRIGHVVVPVVDVAGEARE